MESPPPQPTGNVKYTAFRLHPNEELYSTLKSSLDVISSRLDITKQQKATGAFIATCVGSVHSVTIRLANANRETKDGANEIKVFPATDKFEVLSLVGTISEGGAHLHISLGDGEGRVWGGHLVKASVFTTCEVVLGVFVADSNSGDGGVLFDRIYDDVTGFKELTVSERGRAGWTWTWKETAVVVALGIGFSCGTRRNK
jgi:predicted DNA-binding protein with PD1-like motif